MSFSARLPADLTPNQLTRTVSARSLFFQLVACGTQSVAGQVLVNRGAFALYRAPMIRRIPWTVSRQG